MGYVGLPLLRSAKADRDHRLRHRSRQGRPPQPGRVLYRQCGQRKLAPLVEKGRFSAKRRYRAPAGLRRHRDLRSHAALPTIMSPICPTSIATARDIARALRPSQLVVLESTSYPGTTNEVLKPILEEGGLVAAAVIFFWVFSPEAAKIRAMSALKPSPFPRSWPGADEQAWR